jgi:hypothetical protein
MRGQIVISYHWLTVKEGEKMNRMNFRLKSYFLFLDIKLTIKMKTRPSLIQFYRVFKALSF